MRISDWSSDVCSSDLLMAQPEDQPTPETPEAASDDEAAHKARRTKSVKKQSPAVPIEESVQPDYIVCLEDGKHFKMMKRYLRSTYQMTPDQYRAKWGLPDDYPMVAPNYRAEKSNYAKMVGLGTARIQRKDRKSVVQGKSGSVRVEPGGRRNI